MLCRYKIYIEAICSVFIAEKKRVFTLSSGLLSVYNIFINVPTAALDRDYIENINVIHQKTR